MTSETLPVTSETLLVIPEAIPMPSETLLVTSKALPMTSEALPVTPEALRNTAAGTQTQVTGMTLSAPHSEQYQEMPLSHSKAKLH